MNYRGVEYAIRLGVERGEWVVASSFADNAADLLKIAGKREQAATTARQQAETKEAAVEAAPLILGAGAFKKQSCFPL